MNAGESASPTTHITVCICSYKRPELLRCLLGALSAQDARGRFTHSVIVADNDALESARQVVSDFAVTAAIPVQYRVEPERNIALARNKAIDGVRGDFVAFIDDDEEPTADWLFRLLEAIESYGADGVLGPVLPRFSTPPPEWIVRGRFFDRPCPPTGTWLHWRQTRTGNVLLRAKILGDERNRFRPEYDQRGEDIDFFRRMAADGMRFVWCAEARVFESVPAERCTRTYLLRRALGRGRAPHNQEAWPVAVSLVAAPAYAIALPFLILFGQHVFMRYLIKECDHLSRIVGRLRRGRARPVVEEAAPPARTDRGRTA